MTHPWQQSRDCGRDVLGFVCFIIALPLLMLAVIMSDTGALARTGGDYDYL